MTWLLLVLAGCPHQAAPPVYTTPIPDLVEPDPLDLSALDTSDACPAAVPYLPGKPAPHVDSDGLVTCRGQIVPEARIMALLYDERIAAYWRDQAARSTEYRGIDRLRCEQVAGDRWDYCQDLRHELRAQRTATAVAGVAGFVLGGVIVASIERITR